MRLLLSCLFVAMLLHNLSATVANDSPGFFLKVTKNIPRLGRRSDRTEYESYFMKNVKAIPRIGRSEPKGEDLTSWLASKRMLPTASAGYSVVQPVNSGTLIDLLNKDAIPSDNVKFVHWKDFDRALQLDSELYAKVISLGRRPDRTLQQDLSLGSYVPIFGNDNDIGGDFMLYNRGDNDKYAGGRYDRDYLLYNNAK